MGAKELFVDVVEGIFITFKGNANAKAKYQEFVDMADKVKAKFEGFAINAALESIGIEGGIEGGINEASVTKAINNSVLAGSGVELTNLFDADAIKADLLKFALKKAAEAMGDDLRLTSFDADSVRKVLRGYVRGRIVSELKQQGGVLIEGAPDNAAVLALIASYEKSILKNSELDGSDKAAKNRERQARYRASHKRQWEKQA
jgi:hypothetical protein